jgi:hypothetical protein
MNQLSIKIILALAVLALLGLSVNVCRAQVPGQSQIPAQNWPKSIITPSGAIINLYQPRALSYSGELLKSRSVISVKDAGADDLVFGVAWTTATVSVDSAGRQRGEDVQAGGGRQVDDGVQLAIRAVRVDQLRIPDDTNRADNAFIAAAMEEYIPRILKSISEQEVQRSLDLGKQERALAIDTGVTPVKILVATRPTALVLTDGEPRLEWNDRWRIEVVVNTRYVIVKDTSGKYYLYGGTRWYVAPSATGRYKAFVGLLNRTLRKISNDLKAASYENGVPIDDGDATVKRILVRTEPTLLIQLDGQPKFKAIPGTSLSYIANDPGNIYLDGSTKCYYVPFGNQWYATRDLRDSVGWSAVAQAQLPADLLITIHEPEARLDEEVPQVQTDPGYLPGVCNEYLFDRNQG